MATKQQLEVLELLADKLVGELIVASDPDNWTGAGQMPAAMDQQTRGNRNWDMKNANILGALLMRTVTVRKLMQHTDDPENKLGMLHDALTAEAMTYERQAAEVLKKMKRKGASKA
jgi:hypothetical protein